jgi:hypothetical protein
MHSGSGMSHAPGGVPSAGEPAATNRVQRLGDRVRRPIAFWSNAVHGLLAHLEAVDFPAPRLRVVTGDYEELTWIEGESGSDAWSKVVAEDGLRKWAAFLRRYHDAVADYRPPHEAVWSRVTGGGFVCHGDPGPWNTVWLGDEIVAFIDFDHAHPGSALDDIVYSLEFGAPFRDDATCVAQMRYPAPPDRRRRIEVFCDAYGMSAPAGLATLVADRQLQDLQLVSNLAGRGIEPQVTWVRDGHLDEIRQRIAWTLSSGI